MAAGLPPDRDARSRTGPRPRSARTRAQDALERPERDGREAAATVTRPGRVRGAEDVEEVERR